MGKCISKCVDYIYNSTQNAKAMNHLLKKFEHMNEMMNEMYKQTLIGEILTLTENKKRLDMPALYNCEIIELENIKSDLLNNK